MWQVANQNSSKMQNFEHPHLFKNNLFEQVVPGTVTDVAIGVT